MLLAESAPSATTIASTVPFTVLDRTGVVHKVVGPLVLRPKLSLPSDGPVQVPGPLVVRPGKEKERSRSTATRTGDGSRSRSRARSCEIVNFVKLEEYLQGVIAGEMPHRWPLEALKAQAVAARSYALASLVKGSRSTSTQTSEARSIAGSKARLPEPPRPCARRAARSSSTAAGVATTYCISTSERKDQTHATSSEHPCRTSCPARIMRRRGLTRITAGGPSCSAPAPCSRSLALDRPVLDALGVPASGRLRSLTVQTDRDTETVTAGLLRTSLGLRSTWITVGVLRLDQPRETTMFSAPRGLGGIARALPAPMLFSSPDGSGWTEVAALQRETGGLASVVVKPEQNVAVPDRGRRRGLSAVLVQVAPESCSRWARSR